MDDEQSLNANSDEENKEWINDDTSEEETNDTSILYQIDSSPNDFNLLSYKEFIEREMFIIPNFQRCYVWDLQRASKLIESLIMGLPVPQIFLFEHENEKQLIIDGQQRLLSILFFMKGRFPYDTKRTELKKEIIKKMIDEKFLEDNTIFKDFRLNLKGNTQLHDKTYSELDEKIKNRFDLRTLRSIFIKQAEPKERPESPYASSMYEIFHRLNTGGMNLKPQEIRNTIFGSKFYDLLEDLNNNETWRKIINRKYPDKYQRDKESILRCIALSLKSDSYTPSMAKFLNEFSEETKSMSQEQINSIRENFNNLMKKIENIQENTQENKRGTIFLDNTSKFFLKIFDAVFVAYYQDNNIELSIEKIEKIKEKIIHNSSGRKAVDKKSIEERIKIAKEILHSNE